MMAALHDFVALPIGRVGWMTAGSGYAVLRGEKAPDDALARELGAMGLL